MLFVKTPLTYISKPDILENAGEHVEKWGRKALIIGGKTALASVGGAFYESLKQHGVSYEIRTFEGYPTEGIISQAAGEAVKAGADVLVGAGGGRALDVTKAVGQKTGLPVITVPTVAATCAAWSALTVLYNEEGVTAGGMLLDRSPVLVLADLQVLAGAPVRYLRAGIADTLVKWYETFPGLAAHGKDIHLRFEVKAAELALEVLYESSPQAIAQAESGTAGKALSDVVDSVIFLAGAVGSFRSDAFYGEGLAHPFYNSSTHISGTRVRLHGEKVIFGLLVQLALEKKARAEIEKVVDFLQLLELPVTLEQIGIAETAERDVAIIAEELEKSLLLNKRRKNKPNRAELESAIFLADEIGRNYRTRSERAV